MLRKSLISNLKTMQLHSQYSVHLLKCATIVKKNTIKNCCISARGGIKLHPFGTLAQVPSEVMHVKGEQFYWPSSTYSSIVLYYYYQNFILSLFYRAIFITSVGRSEAHVMNWGIKNGSIVTTIKSNIDIFENFSSSISVVNQYDYS